MASGGRLFQIGCSEGLPVQGVSERQPWAVHSLQGPLRQNAQQVQRLLAGNLAGWLVERLPGSCTNWKGNSKGLSGRKQGQRKDGGAGQTVHIRPSDHG